MARIAVLVLALAWSMTIGSATAPPSLWAHVPISYRIETAAARGGDLGLRFSEFQIGILEKLNRADRDHLRQLSALVVPDQWVVDELAYTTLPRQFAPAAAFPKALVLYLPGQMFGAYEFGTLTRWGPVSSGGRSSPTPPGLFHLNWRAVGHTSTIDPDWFMPWYFNFENTDGRAVHQYVLPGWPASHGCVRLLERDAQWVFGWGESWMLDSRGTRILQSGTPVLVVGAYDFAAPPPWRSLAWLDQTVELPSAPLDSE